MPVLRISGEVGQRVWRTWYWRGFALFGVAVVFILKWAGDDWAKVAAAELLWLGIWALVGTQRIQGDEEMEWQEGDRVVLIRCTDKYTKLEPGEHGTVTDVDDAGTVHVNWDCGSRLGMVFEAGDDIVHESEAEWMLP